MMQLHRLMLPRRMRTTRRSPRLVAVLVGISMVAASASAQQAAFSLPGDPRTAVLVYRDRPAELAGVPPRTLHVYADGYCALSVPAPRRDAGNYELRLPRAELTALIRSVVDAGVVELDPAALRARLRARSASARTTTQVHRFDDEIVEIELRLASYRAAGAAVEGRNVERVLRVHGLGRDLVQHPDDAELLELSGLRDRLVGFMRRPDFRARAGGAP